MPLPKKVPGLNNLSPQIARARVPIAIGAGVLIALAGGFFGFQWYQDQAAEKKERQQETIATWFGRDVAGGIEAALEPVDKAVDPAAIAALLNGGDAAALEAKAREISDQFGQVMGIRIVAPGHDQTDYKSFPPLSYAVLDLLGQSEDAGKAPGVELHFKGEDSENIAALRRIVSADGALVGHLLVALRPSVLKSALAGAQVPSGYAELQQPVSGSKPLVLGRAGDAVYRVGAPTFTKDVPGAAWQVAYWAEGASAAAPAAADSGGLPLIPVAAGAALLLAGGAFVVIRRRRAAGSGADDEEVASAAAPDAAPAVPARAAGEGEGVPSDDGEAAAASPPEAESGAKEPADLPASIFRAYDIRGVVGQGLSAGAVRVIGRAIGSEADALGQKTLVVGRDGRNSSAELSEALIEGLTAAGRDVIDIGRVPTPLVYFATHSLDTGSGVMVTGSHNPPEYNGLKIMLAGETLFGERVAALKTRAESGDFSSGSGAVQQNTEVASDYIRRVTEDIPVALGTAFKVVIDCGNGAAGEVAPQLIRALGHDVVELYCEIDGNFPNHHPDPSQPANLKDLIKSVKENNADIGFAFDGDGDRLGVVDGQGNIIYPDRQLILFAKDVLSRNAGAEIVFDVKCTSRLPKVIEKLGGKPVMWKTGHSFIKSKLKETGAPLAGEMSGHIFFKERWYGFDDALYASARMLEILMGQKQPPAEIFKKLPSGIATPELKVPLPEDRHRAFMEKFESSGAFSDGTVTTIDGVRVDYEDGWGLIRPSNTTPSLILRFEADNKEALKRIGVLFKKTILEIDPDLKLPF